MNAYPDSRWVGLKFTFEFLDVEAQEDATPASSAEDELSQIRQTLDGGSDATPPFISLEHNRWGLGQHFVPIPESIESVTTGWVCSPLSNRVTTFASQPYLEFRFSEPHSSIGFTVVFEESTGEHASQFRVETFNAGGTVVSSKTVENHSATAAVELPTLDYTRVRFTFLKSSRPYSRVRIRSVLFGIIESYDADTVTQATLEYRVDPIAESLPSRECTVRIDNSSQRFNLINPNGIYAYLQQPQVFHVHMGAGAEKDSIDYVSMGDFYFAKASAEDSSLTAEITAYDWFYWLEKGVFKNTQTGSWTLGEAITAIFANAGISCEVDISEDAAATPLLKVTQEMTNREALRLALQASCCTAFYDRRNVLKVLDLSLTEPVDVLDDDNMATPPGVTMENAVNTVELTARNSATGNETVYTASNVPDDELVQVKSVGNDMVDPSMGQQVAEWILAWSQGRLTYSTQERGNPETELGDSVQICDYFGVNRTAIITGQIFKFDGGLSVESKAITNGT